MAEERRHVDEAGGFDVRVPEGWYAEADPEVGGVELAHPDGAGLLHLVGIPQPEGEFPDPAEELYSFLEEQGVELEEDEVEDLELEGGAEMAVCEYVSDDEEEGSGETFWLVGVATAPGALVFATYSCAAGEEEEERETVLGALRSLRLLAAG
ncbi:MAG TPA: hypothetical protein VHG51_19470 [Longimicrobiaceae bacterium]|nr:hypothetical protein [Longimicrobiaceae bacterium]